MTKIGVGVGEEFPVDEPPPPKPDPERDAALEAQRRYWRQRHYLHVATRIALIVLIAAIIVWMFVPHPALAPNVSGYAYHPHFFFPLFPLLLIFLFALAWRRRSGCYDGHHWHDGPRGSDRTGEA